MMGQMRATASFFIFDFGQAAAFPSCSLGFYTILLLWLGFCRNSHFLFITSCD